MTIVKRYPCPPIVGTANHINVTPVWCYYISFTSVLYQATSAPAFGGLTIPYAIFANGTNTIQLKTYSIGCVDTRNIIVDGL